MQTAQSLRPGKKRHQLGFLVSLKQAQTFYNTKVAHSGWGIHIVKNLSQVVRRVTIELSMHAIRDTGGHIMNDRLGLRFHVPEPESGAGTAESPGAEISRRLFFPGSPDVSNDARKIAEYRLPVHFVSRFFFPRRQIHGSGRKPVGRLFVGVVNSHGFLVEPQGFEKIRHPVIQCIVHPNLLTPFSKGRFGHLPQIDFFLEKFSHIFRMVRLQTSPEKQAPTR